MADTSVPQMFQLQCPLITQDRGPERMKEEYVDLSTLSGTSASEAEQHTFLFKDGQQSIIPNIPKTNKSLP